MPGARGYENGVARADRAPLAVNFHLGLSFEDEVDFLRQFVMMTLGGLPGWQGGFGQTLGLHWRIRPVEDAANGRAVRGCERTLSLEMTDFHEDGRLAIAVIVKVSGSQR
jgi:hypothetical protein